jgi:hypothetical protein
METNKNSKQASRSKKIAIYFAAVVVLSGIAWMTLKPAPEVENASTSHFSSNPADRPVTLSPALFSNDPKAQAAYQVAKDIPEVLEQLPCFCGCMDSFGHKNNLYCFSDQHGSVCDICENIALDAKTMHDHGFSIEKIKQTIIEKYSRASES